MHPMGLFISILSLALYSCIMIPLLACVGGLCGSVAAYFSVSPHALRAVALALLSLQPPIMKVHTAAKEALRETLLAFFPAAKGVLEKSGCCEAACAPSCTCAPGGSSGSGMPVPSRTLPAAGQLSGEK